MLFWLERHVRETPDLYLECSRSRKKGQPLCQISHYAILDGLEKFLWFIIRYSLYGGCSNKVRYKKLSTGMVSSMGYGKLQPATLTEFYVE